MTQVIIYTDPETQNVCILHPVTKTDLSIEQIAVKDVPQGVPYRITDASNVPESRDFRDAWTDENPTETVDVCMDKAKAAHMENIRSARNDELSQLDQRQYGEEFDEQRQALRDLPATVDLSKIKTPEELKSFWPDELARTANPLNIR